MGILSNGYDWLELAVAAAEFGLQWLVQSTFVLAAGLAAAAALRSRGPVLQSAIYRTTIVAVLACPLAAHFLSAAGVSFIALELPPLRLVTIETFEVAPPPEPEPAPVAVEASEEVVAEPPPAAAPAEFSASGAAAQTGAIQDGAVPLGAVRSARAAPAEIDPVTVVDDPPPAEPPAAAAPSVQTRIVTSIRWLLAATVIGVSGAWLLGSLALLVRLAIQHVHLARIRGRSVDAGQLVGQLCRDAARHVKVSPPPVARTPFLGSPCLAGIVRPLVLLPEELPDIPLSAVLVHELAHLKRRDNVWGLVRHVTVALLYVQPLVWRLARRMEEAAEAACDDHVVHFGADRQAYATTLVSLAEQNLLPGSSAVVSLVTFRSLLGQRVTRILDHSRRLSVRIGMAALSLVVAGGLSAALVAGLVGPAGEPAVAAGAAQEDKAADETPVDEAPRRVTGLVTLPDGKPAAGADVLLIARRRASFQGGNLDQSSEFEILGQTRSDGQGRFELAADDLSAAPYMWVQLLARSEACALAWRDVNADEQELQFALELAPASQARGRLVTAEGQAAAGVRVDVATIGTQAAGKWRGVDSMSAELPPEIWPRDVVTDAAGWYTVDGVAADADLGLRVDEEPYAPHWWTWKAEEPQHVEVLAPAQVIKGVVVAADTGKPLAHARLTAFQGWDIKRGGMIGVGGQADAEGHFRVNPYPANSYSVTGFGPAGMPYLARKIEFEWPQAASEHEVRVELPRGVLLRGKITEAGSGEPVAGASVRYEPRATNPNTDELVTGWEATAVSDEQGNYAIAVPPGPGYVTVMCAGGKYIVQPTTGSTLYESKPGGRRLYLHAYKTLDVGASEERCDFEVTRGVSVRADVVGPDGKPPERLLVAYQGMWAPYKDEFGDNPRELPSGRLEIHSVPPDGELQVFLLDPLRKNGRVVKLRGQDAGRPLEIKLAPCGSATMRFVDDQGKPVRGVANLGLNMVFRPGTTVFELSSEKPAADETYVANFDRRNHWDLASDEDGRVKYEALIPGVEYQLFGNDENGKGVVERTIRVEPGEHLSLEDYVIRDEDILAAAEDNWLKKQKLAALLEKLAADKQAKSDDGFVVARGRVVDPDGKPVAGAKVWAVHPPVGGEVQEPAAQARSDDAGGFVLRFAKPPSAANPPYAQQAIRIAAASAGFGPGWIAYEEENADKPLTLRLVADKPIEGRIVDLEGRPVTGAHVRVDSIARNEQENLAAWLKALRGGATYRAATYVDGHQVTPPRDELYAAGVGLFPPVETDADGAFRIEGAGRERRVVLLVSGAGIVSTRVQVVTVPTEAITVRFGNPEPYFDRDITIFGSKFQYAAEPSQPIVGKVVDAETRKPLAGVQVVAKKYAGQRISEFGQTPVVTDEQGAFRLDGMPRGAGNIVLVQPAEGQPYFEREVEVPVGANLDAVRLDVELHRGVMIRGRVTNKATGAGVKATVQYVPWPDNPHVAGIQFKVRIYNPKELQADDDGRFELVGLPGEGLILVTCGEEPFPSGQGLEALGDTTARAFQEVSTGNISKTWPTAVRKVDIAETETEVSADVALETGATVDLRVVDAQGKPLDGLMIRGLWPVVAGYRGKDLPAEVQVRALAPDEKRWVFIHHPGRNLGRAIEVDAESAANGPLRVVLEPCGSVTARLLDANGEPVESAFVSVGISLPDNWAMNLAETETDRDGRLRSDAILPGRKYNISVASPQTNWQSVANDLAVAPGETVDLGEFDVTAKERPEPKRTSAASAKSPAAAGAAAEPDDDVLVVRGNVVDPAGKPMAGAEVFALRWHWQNQDPRTPLAKTETNGAGEFEIAYRKSQFERGVGNPRQWRNAAIAAVAEGYGPGWVYYHDVDPDGRVTLKLVDDQPIDGRIVDLEGKPVAGATLSVMRIYGNEEEDLSRWIAAMREGIPYFGSRDYGRPDTSLPVTALELGKTIRTDQNGRFRVTGVGRNRYANIDLSGAGLTVANLAVVTAPVEPFVVEFSDQPDWHRPISFYGCQFEYSAEPSQPIEGTVRDSKTGEPLAGVRVIADRLSGTKLSGVYAAETLSDAEGHYRLEGMPKGDDNAILVIPGDDIPYFMSEVDVPTAPGLEPVKFDIDLDRGMWITGRLSEKGTGRPIQARMHYIPWPDNPHIKDLPEFNNYHLPGSQMRYETDADGRFKLVGLPGRGLVAAVCVAQPYPPGQGVEAIDDLPTKDQFRIVAGVFSPTKSFPTGVHEVRIAEDATEIDVDFPLDPGEKLKLRFVDPQGNLLSNLWIRGLWPKSQYYVVERGGPEVEMLALEPGEKRLLLVLDEERRLGKATTISVADAKDGTATVTLEPCATVKARLLDEQGQPVRGGQIDISPMGENDWAVELRRAATDDNGVLNVATLLPGSNYHISLRSPEVGYHTVAKDLAVAPGETIDLGEFDVTAKDRPEPKRAAAEAPNDQPAAQAKTKPVDAAAVDADRFDFAGKVVDPDGKPVAGAKIYVVYYTPNAIETPPRAETKADGSFAFSMRTQDFDAGEGEMDAPWEFAKVVAAAPGYGIGWTLAAGAETSGRIMEAMRAKPSFARLSENVSTDSTLRLVADDVPIEGRIINLEGRPVEGAKVQLIELSANRADSLDGWLDAVNKGADYYTARRQVEDGFTGLYVQKQLARVLPATSTDAEGRFRITGIGRERIVQLQIEPPGYETRQVYARTRPGPTLYLLEETRRPDEPKLAYYGATFDFAAAPSRPVVGVVRDAETGTPLANVRVSSNRIAGDNTSGWSQRYINTTTDAQGRYRLEGLPIGDSELIAMPPEGEPYLCLTAEVETTPAAESATRDFELARGVWIRGRVTDAVSGKGVRARIEYFAFNTNPHLRPGGKRIGIESPLTFSDSQGHYAILGLPGRGLVTALAGIGEDYPRGAGAEKIEGGRVDGQDGMFHTSPYFVLAVNTNALAEVNPAPEDEAVAQDFVLDPGKGIDGVVLDPAGKPLAGAMCAGRVDMAYWRELDTEKFSVRHLKPGERRRLFFYHKGRKLAGGLVVGGDEPGPLEVKLQPWGTVRGRALLSNGDPAEQATLGGALAENVEEVAQGILPDLRDQPIDEDGHFTIEGLAPGFTYAAGVVRGSNYLGKLIDAVEVAPGETKDLGDLTIGKPYRAAEAPTAKKTAKTPETKRAAAVESKPESKAAAAAETENRFEFAGKVVDPTGKPVAGAKIYLVYYTPKEIGAKPRAETAADGSFEFAMNKREFDRGDTDAPWEGAIVVAVAPGYGIAWALAAGAETSGRIIEKLRAKPSFARVQENVSVDSTLRLVADDVPIEGRIVNLEGQPIGGAKIYVTGLEASRENSLDAWLNAVENQGADFYQARRHLSVGFGGLYLRSQIARLWPPLVTDAEGRFRIDGIGRERIVSLRIEAPEYETRGIHARTRPGPTLYVPEEAGRSDEKLAYYGARFDYAAAPSRAVVGVVRDKETGQPLAGVRVSSNRIAGQTMSHRRHIHTITDDQGRYRLAGLPIGTNELIVIPPDGKPYLSLKAEVETTPTAESATHDFELVRGVWIRGRVTDAVSGEGVRARIEYFAFTTNPHVRPGGELLRIDSTDVWTNADGRYEIVGLPGRGLITAMASPAEDYPRGAGAEKINEGRVDGREMFRTWPHYANAMNASALVEVNPAPDDEAIDQNIVLNPGEQIEGIVLDPDGKPLAGARCLGQFDFLYWTDLDSEKFAVRHLEPGEKRRLFFYHTGRKLSGALIVSDGEPGPLEVKLEPWGVVRGRMLTQDGDPAEEVTVTGGLAADVDEAEQGILPFSRDQRTDREGNFTIEGLAPGFVYAAHAVKGSRYLGELIGAITLAPGETKDLGDLTIGKPYRAAEKPAPKKTTDEKTAKTPAKKRAAAVASNDDIELSGSVVEPDGKPAAGAKIYVLENLVAVREPRLVAQTNADGSFSCKLAKNDFNTGESSEPWLTAKLIAVAKGFGPAWALAVSFEQSGKLLAKVPLYPNFSNRDDEIARAGTLHLVADDVPIEGRIVDLEGNPVAGARIRVLSISASTRNTLDGWLELARDPSRAFFEAYNQLEKRTGFNERSQMGRLFGPIKSDAEGRFRIEGVGRERIALLQIEGTGLETHQVSARTRSGETIEIVDPRWPKSQARVYYPATFDHVAGPSRPVVGVVRDKDTGQPIAGVRVEAYRLAGIGVQPSPNTLFDTVTDREGRYELPGLPVGRNELMATGPESEPYLVSALPAEVNLDTDQIVVDFALKRGVWIHGRVTDAGDGRPLRGTVQYYAFLDNPHYDEAPGFDEAFAFWFHIDDDGRFRIPGLAGPGIVGVRAENYSDYPRGVGADGIEGRQVYGNSTMFRTGPGFCHANDHHAVKAVDPKENGDGGECNFALVPGRSIEGTVLDPDGRPLAGALMFGSVEATVWTQLRGSTFRVRNLEPGKPRLVQFCHVERHLAGSIALEGDEQGPLTVKLEPWGAIAGRMLDANGDPVGNTLIYARTDLEPGVMPKGFDRSSDAEGRFRIEGFAPQVPYHLAVIKEGRLIGTVVEGLKLGAGETKELGDVRLKRSNK